VGAPQQLIARRSFAVYAGTILLVALVIGCQSVRDSRGDGTATPPGPSDALRQQAEDAYAMAREAMLSTPLNESDQVWNLQRVLESTPDDQLEAHVLAQLGALEGDPFELLINPEAGRSVLPEDPGSGLFLWFNYLLASVGTPEDRAIEWISNYLSAVASGYVLTHQILVIEWARQTGLEVPTTITSQLEPLLERLSAEHVADTAFSDLYAERAAVLLLYGDASPQQAATWVTIIVDSQVENGTWEGGEITVSFDSETATTDAATNHTTTLSMLALRLYLDRVSSSPPNGA